MCSAYKPVTHKSFVARPAYLISDSWRNRVRTHVGLVQKVGCIPTRACGRLVCRAKPCRRSLLFSYVRGRKAREEDGEVGAVMTT